MRLGFFFMQESSGSVDAVWDRSVKATNKYVQPNGLPTEGYFYILKKMLEHKIIDEVYIVIESNKGPGYIELDGIPFIGGLLKGIEKFVDLAERVEDAGGEIKRVQEIKGAKGKVRGIYGFSVRTGIGERPKIQTFGNIKETKKGPAIVETREPIVDVFDEKDHLLIVVELPGVSKDAVKLNLKGDILILEASEGDKRKYYKEILLPSKVNAETEERTYKNGILEIKFKKTKTP